MSEFWVKFEAIPPATVADPVRLRIGVGNTILTRLLRDQGSQPDDALLATPVPLAFWLCDNWWRLRWETIPPGGRSATWRLAHELTAVGGGFAWPRLSIWGDVDRIGVLSQADPPGVVGPVRFLADALMYVDGSGFEQSIDGFLDQVLNNPWGENGDLVALSALVEALRSERSDPDVAQWRRIEARLGCAPDQAADALIEAIGELVLSYGLAAVEEAISAKPGADTAAVLEQEVLAARSTGQCCDFSALLTELPPVEHRSSEPPWVPAERNAQQIRSLVGIPRGPIKNATLAELLGVPSSALRKTADGRLLDYGLRVGEQGTHARQWVALRSKWPEARRFELCRALGDAVWARDDVLGPITDTSTSRQKFQRAFAQSLLCPFDDLHAYLETDSPNDDDIAAAGRHFQVAPRMVETVLVNKGVVDRGRFADRLEAT